VRSYRGCPQLALGGPTLSGLPIQLERIGTVRVHPDVSSDAGCDDAPVSVTVLIVDDHAGFRAAARALLQAEGFEVVGEAPDGASGLEAARALQPRVVLLDVQLPDLDGFVVCERLLAEPDPPFVVLTSTQGRSSLRRRLAQSPARGFIWKGDLTGAALAALIDGG